MPKTVHTTVFKAAQGGGNPCPVTLDADSLTTEQMLQFAQETGEECAFVLSPTERGCDFCVRYFLPTHELSMCMHATIAAATVIVKSKLVNSSPIYFQSERGRVRIDWEKQGKAISVVVEQFAPEFIEEVPSRAEISEVLDVSESDIAPHPIINASTSRFKLMVPIINRKILDSLKPKWERLWNLCDACKTTGIYVFTIEENEDRKFFTRQFPNRGGYNEDPATGVAASALCAYVLKYGIVQAHEGWNSINVFQGFAIGRPSVIRADTRFENGEIVQTRVGGTAEIA